MATFEHITVNSPNPDGAIPVYYYKHPTATAAIIVMQEWWGVNDQIKQQALEWFSAEFTVAIPDFYRGKASDDREEAGHLRQGLNWDGAVKDIGLVADYLLANGSQKVGAIGFCMGGALAAAAAVEGNKDGKVRIHAVAPFYGLPSFDAYPPSQLTVPVLGCFGSEDFSKGFSDVETATKFHDELNKHEGKYGEQTVRIFEKATHGFCNPNHEDPHNVNAKFAAEAKILAHNLFQKHLQ